MTQPTAAQTIEAIMREEAQVAVAILDLTDQLDAAAARRKALRGAIEGVKLGQAFANEVAAAQAAQEAAPTDAE